MAEERLVITRKTTTGAPDLAALVVGEMCLVEPDRVIYQKIDASTLISFVSSQVLTQAAFDALSQPEKDASGLVLIVG